MNRKVGVVFSYAKMFVEIFSAAFFTPLLIKSLGQSQYGVYQLVYSITAYITLLDLGVGNAVVKYMAKYRVENDIDSQKKFMGIITSYYMIVSAVVLAVGAIIILIFPTAFAKGLSVEEIALARKLLFITVLSSAFTMATAGFTNTLMAYERFSYVNIIGIAANIIKIVIAIAILKLGYGSMGVVCTYFAINIVTRFLYTYYVLVKLKVRPSFKRAEKGLIKEIVFFSSFVLLQMLAIQINAMTDTVLLGILAKGSAAIIAVYGVGSQIIQYFKTIGTQVNGVLMPGVVRLIENGADSKTLQNEMVRIGRLLFMMLGIIFAVFAVFGQHFIVLWAGEENRQGFFVAIAIMAPTMFSLIQTIGNQMLWAMNKHKMQAVIQVISAVLNIFLTALLIKWNPLVGAVIGTVIALTVGDVICMNVMFKKEIKVKLTEYYSGLFKGILPSILIASAAGVLFKLVGLENYGWLGLIMNCVVMIAVYAACMLLFGMNNSEKEMIRNIFLKIFKKQNLANKKGE